MVMNKDQSYRIRTHYLRTSVKLAPDSAILHRFAIISELILDPLELDAEFYAEFNGAIFKLDCP
jgi:hypothetical protein